MPPPIGFSRARETLSDLVTDAVRSHRPISIKRRDELAVLIGAADLDGILAAYEFRPEVFFEDDAVSIWLPELILYGRGRTYDCAVEDLVEEVRAYVDDYLERSVAYLNAPNRSGQFPYVVRALVADAVGRLRDVLLAPPSESRAAVERAEAAVR